MIRVDWQKHIFYNLKYKYYMYNIELVCIISSISENVDSCKLFFLCEVVTFDVHAWLLMLSIQGIYPGDTSIQGIYPRDTSIQGIYPGDTSIQGIYPGDT